jgi:hypothetical protein
MDEVTQSHGRRRLAAQHSDDVTPVAPPRLIEEAARIFLALGITATDLRLRAKPGSPLGVLADAMETPDGDPMTETTITAGPPMARSLHEIRESTHQQPAATAPCQASRVRSAPGDGDTDADC